ncbi:suppressor of fused domain protein [Arthrobacter sp. fls2-241-R2A-200]|uniref:suppressor of fused domain protein n=1 Tax=Arthrobacter sp. fls2-241-R2A-200 TaxID=3040281 RepID=UPI00254CB5CA|nr:suppressor of fused domain protein [Arthrobacter sp. fls2-241-R2A-200]
MPTRLEQFLSHLDDLSGGIEPRFFPVEKSHPGLPGVTAIVYDNLPERGMITGFTYGISLANNPLWRFGKPELCISVKSDDVRWPLALAHIGEGQRGNPFQIGDTINVGERIAPDSDMTAFVIFAPAVLDREDYTGINIGETLPINLSGLYPIHEAERRYIQDHGIGAFWDLDWDPYDVSRPSVV